jgi:hypothetical protein
MCHQSAGLIQSIIEKAGIPTVSITLLPAACNIAELQGWSVILTARAEVRREAHHGKFGLASSKS